MLEVEGLVKVYPGPVEALAGVDLAIPVGLFGLLGPNGSGKTTLMRILAGQLEPTGGRVRLDGEEVTDRPERVWPRLGYLPQRFGFHPNLTGRATLLHLLRLKGVRAPDGLAKLVDRLLELVHLTEAAGRRVKTYSGGMLQRLGIAQALAGEPRLVIVDEPTAGLDPEERIRLYRLLAEVAATRIVLLSTHLVEDVAVLCSRFAVLRRGRLRSVTTPARARAELDGHLFEGEADEGLLAALALRGVAARSVLVEGRERIRLHAPDGEAPRGFRPVAATLEDVYHLALRERRA